MKILKQLRCYYHVKIIMFEQVTFNEGTQGN